MSALGPVTFRGEKHSVSRSVSSQPAFGHHTTELSCPQLEVASRNQNRLSTVIATHNIADDEQIPDLRRKNLFTYLQGFGRFIYLTILISLGVVFALVQSLQKSTDRKYEVNVSFSIVSLASSSVLLIILIYQIAMLSRRTAKQQERSNSNTFGHAVSFYTHDFFLRIGMIVFSLCATILSALQLISLKDALPLDTKFSMRLAMYILHIVFYSLQTYFVFKYKPQDLRKLKEWSSFLLFVLIHLVAANFTIWFNTVVMEANELDKMIKLRHKSLDHNITSSGITNSTKQNFLNKAQIFFFPTVIEYTILVAGVLINMYLKLSQDDETVEGDEGPSIEETPRNSTVSSIHLVSMFQGITGTQGERTSKIFSSSRDSTYSLEAMGFVPIRTRHNLCDKAHTGFFLSILLVAFYFVYLACNFIFDGRGAPYSTVLMVTHIAVHGLGLVLVLFVIFRMVFKFQYIEGEDNFVDNFLITISFFAIVLFTIFVITPQLTSVFGGNNEETSYTDQVLKLVLGLLDLFQFLAQTGFILVGINLRAATEEQRRQKPGNTVLMILISINIMTWLEESLLYKTYISSDAYITYYGEASWSLITSACKPLVVFYRFHAAAMLAEIWTSVYKAEMPSH